MSGGSWGNLALTFYKCVLKVTRPEAIQACKYDQVYAGLKVGIGAEVHGDKSIWDTNSTK